MPNVLTPHANVFIFAQFPSARYRRRSPAYAQLVVHLFFAHCLVTIYLIAAFGHRHPTPTRQAKATSRPFVFDFAFACTAGVLLIFFLSLSSYFKCDGAAAIAAAAASCSLPPHTNTKTRASANPAQSARKAGWAGDCRDFLFFSPPFLFRTLPEPLCCLAHFLCRGTSLAWQRAGPHRTPFPSSGPHSVRARANLHNLGLDSLTVLHARPCVWETTGLAP